MSKTKLTLTEKTELFKLRAKKFTSFMKTRYMKEKPIAARNMIESINEIWNEISEDMEKQMNQ